MLFYSDPMSSVYPVSMTSQPRRTRMAYHPHSVSMRGPVPHTMPVRYVQRARDDDLLSHMLGFPVGEEYSTTSDSDDQELLSFHLPCDRTCRRQKRRDKSKKQVARPTANNECEAAKDGSKNISVADASCNPGKCTKDVVISRMDMRGVDPSHIDVKTNDEKKTITVSAKREHRTPFGYMQSEHSHVLPIPEGIAPRDIRSFLSPEGVLHLQATRRPEAVTTQKQALAEAEDKESKNNQNDVSTETARSLQKGVSLSEKAPGQTIKNSDTLPDDAISFKGDGQNTQTTLTGETLEADDFSDTNRPMETDKAEAVPDDVDTEVSNVETGDNSDHKEEAKTEQDCEVQTDVKTPTDVTETGSATLTQFDMRGFSDDDIKLKVSEDTGSIEISAEHKEDTPNGYFVRKLYRSFPLPQGVAPKDIGSSLSPEGIFYLTAPKSQLALTE